MKAALKVVPTETPPLDITLAMRAEIQARDWSRVQIEGDRSRPIVLGDRPKRGWRG
jgi:hypothetical protein